MRIRESLDTERKMIVHKTFKRRPERLQNVYLHSVYILDQGRRGSALKTFKEFKI